MAKKSLTVKERKLVKAKAQGKSNKESYLKAGYAPSTDKAMVVNTSRVLARPNVKEALQAELAKQGINIESVVKPIAEGLRAEKVSIVGNGDSAMAEITPDHNVRIKSSQIASKWLGLENQEGSVNVHFHAHQAEQKAKYDL